MNDRIHNDLPRRPDVRRRFRLSQGVGNYTLKTLIEALRLRGKPLHGSTVALLGFPERTEGGTMHAHAIRGTLKRHGASVRTFDPNRTTFTIDALEDVLNGADAAIIAVDAPIFRLVSRGDFRKHHLDIVIPTDLRSK